MKNKKEKEEEEWNYFTNNKETPREDKKKKRLKYKVSSEQLENVCAHVFSKGDKDGNMLLDYGEAKEYCRDIMLERYPNKEFKEHLF